MQVKLNGINLFDFQTEAYEDITTHLVRRKKTIQVKAPTGAGKTVILIALIDNFYMEHINDNSAFIWFCPGAGELEEQSQKKMKKYSFLKGSETQNLQDALLCGFDRGTTTFINWEAVNNTNKRTALQESEKKNLYDRISDAHADGRTFYIIVDEAHKDDTLKAKTIMDAFKAAATIEVSATIAFKGDAEKVIIPDQRVIDAGLIAKEIVVNEDFEKSNGDYFEDDRKLIDMSLKTHQEIIVEYKKYGVNINPLVVVQFPDKGDKNQEDERVNAILEYLKTCGYSTDNQTVAMWFSGNKTNVDGIADFNSPVCFLLMKQAIATGWDCPRAKILAKIRTAMKDSFQIQTVGRIRRMPEQKHYGSDILDCCYVYTYDAAFTQDLFNAEPRAVSKRLLTLKDIAKDFIIPKELKSDTTRTTDSRDAIDKFANEFASQFGLKFRDYKNNEDTLKAQGFIFTNTIEKELVQGRIKTLDLDELNKLNSVSTNIAADSREAKLLYMRVYDKVSRLLDIDMKVANALLRKVFFKKTYGQKILNLSVDYFYGFVIMNDEKIFEICRNIAHKHNKKNTVLKPKTVDFKILLKDRLRYDINSKDVTVYNRAAYENYTHEFTTPNTRSVSEQKLEEILEASNKVEWFYKNGDSGDNYFSIVYLPYEYSNKEKLFFPDYIIKCFNGSIWIVEAKGGENKDGEDQNIDNMIVSKFDALQRYVNQQTAAGIANLNFGFVRYSSAGELLFNNTGDVDDMSSSNWKIIKSIF